MQKWCRQAGDALDLSGKFSIAKSVERNVAAVTVSANELEVIPFWVAVMLLEPTAAPVAKPVTLMLTDV